MGTCSVIKLDGNVCGRPEKEDGFCGTHKRFAAKAAAKKVVAKKTSAAPKAKAVSKDRVKAAPKANATPPIEVVSSSEEEIEQPNQDVEDEVEVVEPEDEVEVVEDEVKDDKSEDNEPEVEDNEEINTYPISVSEPEVPLKSSQDNGNDHATQSEQDEDEDEDENQIVIISSDKTVLVSSSGTKTILASNDDLSKVKKVLIETYENDLSFLQNIKRKVSEQCEFINATTNSRYIILKYPTRTPVKKMIISNEEDPWWADYLHFMYFSDINRPDLSNAELYLNGEGLFYNMPTEFKAHLPPMEEVLELYEQKMKELKSEYIAFNNSKDILCLNEK